MATLLEAGASQVTVADAHPSLVETATFCGALTVEVMKMEKFKVNIYTKREYVLEVC